MHLFSRMANCGSGSITRKSYDRKSYTRKNGVHVKSTHVGSRCITNRGAAGKWTNIHHTRGIGKLRKGRLGVVGYSSHLPNKARHAALQRAVRRYGALPTYRMLGAIYVYTKRTNPRLSAMYKSDRNYVGRMVGYKH